jgi:hypothetical protein
MVERQLLKNAIPDEYAVYIPVATVALLRQRQEFDELF